MITARGLVQTFHTKQGATRTEVRAVDGVDLDVAEGEVVGFLGPNGAGQDDHAADAHHAAARRPRARPPWPATTSPPSRCRCGAASATSRRRQRPRSVARAGDEVVDHGMLYGMTAADARAAGSELFAQLDLEGLWTRMPKSMSGGQRRRLDIAMGLIHEPTLVFLDEPTTGLDPQARANLWEHIADLRSRRGATVFLTTHYLDEADALCDRILIIDHGRIVAADTPDTLKAQVAGDLVDLRSDLALVGEAAGRLGAIAVPLDGGAPVEVEGRHVRARVPHAGTAVPGLLRELHDADVTLDSIQVVRPTLDDVFLTLTGRSLRDAEAATETRTET